jgi:hypothetical protein
MWGFALCDCTSGRAFVFYVVGIDVLQFVSPKKNLLRKMREIVHLQLLGFQEENSARRRRF